MGTQILQRISTFIDICQHISSDFENYEDHLMKIMSYHNIWNLRMLHSRVVWTSRDQICQYVTLDYRGAFSLPLLSLLSTLLSLPVSPSPSLLIHSPSPISPLPISLSLPQPCTTSFINFECLKISNTILSFICPTWKFSHSILFLFPPPSCTNLLNLEIKGRAPKRPLTVGNFQ